MILQPNKIKKNRDFPLKYHNIIATAQLYKGSRKKKLFLMAVPLKALLSPLELNGSWKIGTKNMINQVV